MRFYAPAQIVSDARGHGVEIRPVCVNASRWDCTPEVVEAVGDVPEDDGTSVEKEGDRFAVRLGLRMVRGRSLLFANPEILVRDALDDTMPEMSFPGVATDRSGSGRL